MLGVSSLSCRGSKENCTFWIKKRLRTTLQVHWKSLIQNSVSCKSCIEYKLLWLNISFVDSEIFVMNIHELVCVRKICWLISSQLWNVPSFLPRWHLCYTFLLVPNFHLFWWNKGIVIRCIMMKMRHLRYGCLLVSMFHLFQ